MNRLYFRDNLRWLSDRKEFPDTSVDLVYLAFAMATREASREKQTKML